MREPGHILSLPKRDDILHSDGWPWLVRILHQQRRLGALISARGSCRQKRCAHRPLRIQAKSTNGRIRVAQLLVEWARLRWVHFCPPPLLSVASPRHLHFHKRIRSNIGLQLGVDIWEFAELLKRKRNPFITHRTKSKVLFGIHHCRNGEVHHWNRGVGDEVPGSQQGAHFLPDRPPFFLSGGLGDVHHFQKVVGFLLNLLSFQDTFSGSCSTSSTPSKVGRVQV